MSDVLTNARPYAKAIFNIAVAAQQLAEWQDVLNALAMITEKCKSSLLDNPNLTLEQKLSLFSPVTKHLPASTNLLQILASHKKLSLLPTIANSYQKLFFEHKKILKAKIISAFELTNNQKETITQALKKRYQKQILLQCQTDRKLIGGAKIYVSNQIFDGSIKGMLQNLKHSLLSEECVC